MRRESSAGWVNPYRSSDSCWPLSPPASSAGASGWWPPTAGSRRRASTGSFAIPCMRPTRSATWVTPRPIRASATASSPRSRWSQRTCARSPRSVFSCATRPIGTTWIASAGAWRRICTETGRASQGPGMHTASPRLTGRERALLLGALALLSCATLAFQVLQVVVLSRLADAGLVTIALAATGTLAALLLGAALSPRRALAAALVLGAVLALVPRTGTLFAFGPESQKFYGQLLARGPAGGSLDRQQWNDLGRLDAIMPGPAIADFEFARQAKELVDAGCAFRLLFSNGYNWTFTVDFKGHEPERQSVFGRWVQNAPYLFTHAPEVLNLGSGGGVDVYLAMAHGARSATGVEINPLMIEASTRWYPEDWDGLWQKSGVTLRELDARTYVNTTERTYDVITLNAVDTGGTQASLLSVNFLYTMQAFRQYLRVLRPGGVIFLTRPRAQLLRAVTAAAGALRDRGTAAIERHFAVLGSRALLSAAIYAAALTDQQIEAIRQRVQDGYLGGGLQYLPGADTATNLFTGYFAALRSGDEAGYFRRAALRAEPTTDDRPYFYQLEPDFLRSRAGRLLLLILLWVTSIGIALLFVPLRRLSLPHKNRIVLGNLVYFVCLGLGFMLVEICLMPKLSLFLGH